MLKIEDIARDMGISTRTVYRWIKAGKLKAFMLSKTTRIDEEDYRKFKQEHLNRGD